MLLHISTLLNAINEHPLCTISWAQLMLDGTTNWHMLQPVYEHENSALKSHFRIEFYQTVWTTCVSTKCTHRTVTLNFMHVSVMQICQRVHAWPFRILILSCAGPFRILIPWYLHPAGNCLVDLPTVSQLAAEGIY